MNHLVISFITEDRPGLVDTLSNVVKSHKGNWQTSSMHHLSGYFAGVLELAVDDKNCQPLINAINALSHFKVNIEQAKPVKASANADVILELTANDREGIVQEISSTIHHNGGNLLKLVSSQDNAPHSGQALFKAKLTVSVSSGTIDTLIEALENLADDLMVDISR
jgi:glycine cleavage system regulatory protein